MNAPMLPPGFQQAPVMQAFDSLLAEHKAMFETLQQIARTDSRDGLLMKEAAADAVRQILESQIEARVRARSYA